MLRFTGRAGEGLAGKLLNITQASLVAVSQDAGESEVGFPRTQGNQKGASPARGGIRQGLGGFAEFWLGRILDALLRSA